MYNHDPKTTQTRKRDAISCKQANSVLAERPKKTPLDINAGNHLSLEVATIDYTIIQQLRAPYLMYSVTCIIQYKTYQINPPPSMKVTNSPTKTASI